MRIIRMFDQEVFHIIVLVAKYILQISLLYSYPFLNEFWFYPVMYSKPLKVLRQNKMLI